MIPWPVNSIQLTKSYDELKMNTKTQNKKKLKLKLVQLQESQKSKDNGQSGILAPEAAGAKQSFRFVMLNFSQPAYEITAFRHITGGGICYKYGNLYYVRAHGRSPITSYNCTLEARLGSPVHEIYSVKNASGIEFKLGDLVKTNKPVDFTEAGERIERSFAIVSIRLVNDEVILWLSNPNPWSKRVLLKNARKA